MHEFCKTSVNKRHWTQSGADSEPLIGLELWVQTQCALATTSMVAAKNIAKYSDYVVIISVNS